MPSLTFVLPHWLYWLGLLLFPLVPMYLVRHQKQREAQSGTSLSLAYFLLLTGGFVGLHRFYLRSVLGFVFIPLFCLLLYANAQGKNARNQLSEANNAVSVAEFEFDETRYRAHRDQRTEDLPKIRKAEDTLYYARRRLADAHAESKGCATATQSILLIIGVLLLIDVFRIPRLAKNLKGDSKEEQILHSSSEPDRLDTAAAEKEKRVRTRLTDSIDRLNSFTGEYIAYWSIIGVFVYYYEVLARYVFNSPTNWAHEGMFLMFGMQYLLAGGFALHQGAHVRVDVLYLYLSDRTKALIDVVTSIFFFIFAGTLFWSGLIFFKDSVDVWEVSFTEWAVQYWPVKFAIPLGAALLILQGLSQVLKNVLFLVQPGEHGEQTHGA